MFIANTPLGSRGQPEDIARAAVFLASDDAAWITGEQFRFQVVWFLNS
jgi:3-oxoacyl-[acyl-carrier protein] reductase